MLLWLGLRRPHRREFVGLMLLDAVRAVALPSYLLGDYRKLWQADGEFLERRRQLDPHSNFAAERHFFLRSLLGLVKHLPGDTAEAGVFQGTSSWFICESLAPFGKRHHAFDSFEGISAPGDADGEHWFEGDLAASEDAVRNLLAPFGAEVHRGWIPDCFANAGIAHLCFAHIDVDLYEPTLESMRFFYPRLVPGGVLVCDDYGFLTCPGATRAVDEYMSDKPEEVIHAPTGQAFIVKQ